MKIFTNFRTMNTEQKAKAYDEALERMKSWARGEHPECFTEAQKTAEFIFPELCESKDERIRKELIEFVKSRGGFKQEYIAWLEKQGEQKSNPVLDIEIPFGANDSELQEASYHIPEGFHAEIDGNGVVIKRGEQKPVGFNIGDEITVNGQVCRVVAVDNLDWSEEDEKMVANLVDYFKVDDALQYTEKQVVDWLKSLKQRIKGE